jgi:hypothetical protein
MLTTLSPSCADCLEILGASTSWNTQGLSRPVMGLLYLYQPSRRPGSSLTSVETPNLTCFLNIQTLLKPGTWKVCKQAYPETSSVRNLYSSFNNPVNRLILVPGLTLSGIKTHIRCFYITLNYLNDHPKYTKPR